ncbi:MULTISPECIES: ABC1 kinase family protein [Lachnospiraceae]|uniref:AarF/UbiB family protein n=1 Tax=Faecalicatena acetigenes TaxID=2981790 RepID=A0ABT2TDE4_9FIRM|nr:MULTISPECIES: lipopolysaccharide core heptose(II) kinase RfaY [Lachnospiraceae]MCU6748246.1 AarF/UbiB family protein [Faecalicatena acetigenes]RGT70909.1 AarF/ABC1/UbiB kinase family protein [Ruminococcus sp. AF18-22]SCI33441.1 Probable ubiquinone biosynthesis protein UbiB [uncultured Clostridium sp.]
MNKQGTGMYSSRLKEITAVLRKHGITGGITPVKLRLILEDLGPTFIKIGQIMSMHSDILPKEYCEELTRLRAEVTPMSFDEVTEILEKSYGIPWQKVFLHIEEKPLGSASIAQVHKAVLKSGKDVVVKIQRQGIYEKMARDIALLHKAVKLIPPVSVKGLADLDMVLDELWAVTREEMNFLKEASNMEEFAKKNKDIAFVGSPRLYQEYTTSYVLVMEYIDGCGIDDKEKLLEEGYDLKEIGTKLVDNFIKQVMEDGFFHADPHSGNVKIREGKIIWIDMGMMGRLTEHDREMIGKAVRGVALHEVELIQEAVLALGEFKEKPDQSKLHEDIDGLLLKYGSMDMGNIDIAAVMTDLMEVMKENKIKMPHGLTMLARSMTHMEGVLADIAPEINMVDIASARIAGSFFKNLDLKKELKSGGRSLYRSLQKAVDIPSLLADILRGYLKGQTRINLDLHVSSELSELLRRLVRNIVMGLWVMALLISSSIICTTDMSPKIWGIPAIGAFGYLIAFVIVMYVFVKHLFSKK